MSGFAQGREITSAEMPCKPSPSAHNYTGYGYGISSDISVARNKANIQAMQELSASIKSQMRSVTSLYVSQNNGQHAQEFESLINESVNETLENVQVSCQKQENNQGKVKVYIALELGKNTLLKKIETKTQDAKFDQLDLDKKKFEEIFNNETGVNSND